MQNSFNDFALKNNELQTNKDRWTGIVKESAAAPAPAPAPAKPAPAAAPAPAPAPAGQSEDKAAAKEAQKEAAKATAAELARSMAAYAPKAEGTSHRCSRKPRELSSALNLGRARPDPARPFLSAKAISYDKSTPLHSRPACGNGSETRKTAFGGMMATGLLALLDDVAAIAKVAASSLDDVVVSGDESRHQGGRIVIDDAAVTPRYVVGFASNRELPIIGKIALGSLKNKLLFLLPAALLLSFLAPWAITPLLMAGGLFLCFEGFEKLHHALKPHDEAHADAAGKEPPLDARALEDEKVSGAIRTDIITLGGDHGDHARNRERCQLRDQGGGAWRGRHRHHDCSLRRCRTHREGG